MVAFNTDFTSAAERRDEFLNKHRTRLLGTYPALADIENDGPDVPLRFIFDSEMVLQEYLTEEEAVATLVDDLLDHLPADERFEIIPT